MIFNGKGANAKCRMQNAKCRIKNFGWVDWVLLGRMGRLSFRLPRLLNLPKIPRLLNLPRLPITPNNP